MDKGAIAGLFKPPPGWRIYWNHQGVHATDDKLWLFRTPPFWPATNAIERDIERINGPTKTTADQKQDTAR